MYQSVRTACIVFRTGLQGLDWNREEYLIRSEGSECRMQDVEIRDVSWHQTMQNCILVSTTYHAAVRSLTIVRTS